MSDTSSRRGSTSSAPPRRDSEVLRRASEISRRESAVSTTLESEGTLTPEPRRKSSVFATPGEWRPSDKDTASVASSRRDSAGSQTSISRRPSGEQIGTAEISFSNGEYTNVVARRTSPSPSGLRKPSLTPSHGSSPSNPLDAKYTESAPAPEDAPKRRLSSTNSAPFERDGSAISSLEDDVSNRSQLDRQPSDKPAIPSLELPPLPPTPSDKSKRFPAILASATRPKVASRLRSMIKRSSSDRISDKGEESATEPESEDAPELNGHYNEYENFEQPLSPGRARIYTVDQTRRGSFLPINRIKNEGGGGPRRGSVRLSEADVGLLLGKISRISSDTLRQAAMEGNTKLCEALIRGSVPVDEADIDGKTALMFAAEAGKGDTTEHLLSLGATVDMKVENGMTALYFAVNGTKLSCVRVLVAWGADCNTIVNGDTIFTLALLQIEGSLALSSQGERAASYTQTSEVCRVMVKESKALPIVRRERLRKPTLFLLDEWVRAREAGEVLVVPPMDKLVEGEKTLINFLKQHRQRVNIIATIKIWFVVSFIGFDLATREMKMTPARIMTYVVLYIGAYYL